MREGDVVLTPLPQADGLIKNRPALLLRQLPPFGDFLACGISTQIQHAVVGFDEVIRIKTPTSPYPVSGPPPSFDWGFLALLPYARIAGTSGRVSRDSHQRLLVRLSEDLDEKR